MQIRGAYLQEEECRSGLDAAQKSDASWDFNTVSCCDLQRAA